MSIKMNAGRQEVIAAKVVGNWDDLENDIGNAESAISVPAGAIVVGGYVNVLTAFDSTTSDTLDVGDGGDPDRYSATPVNLQAVGVTELDVTGYKYPTADTIDVMWLAGSAATSTVGQFEIVVEYIVEGRAAFSQD